MFSKKIKIPLLISTAVVLTTGLFLLSANLQFTSKNNNQAGLTILTPHSTPKKDNTWSIAFKTGKEEKGNLMIIPNDVQTQKELSFEGLFCDSKKVNNAVILMNGILFVKDWNCQGTAQLKNKVLTQGEHTFKFQFNNRTEYAYNATPTWQWAKRLGGTGNDLGYGITTDSANNIIIVGRIWGDGDVNGDGDATDGGAESSTGYGSFDILISVFNSSGTWQWAKRLGGTGSDIGLGVVVDSANNIIVTGYITGDGDANGDGDLTDGGAESSTGYGSFDVLISVFNSSGAWQWAKRLGGTNGDNGMRITTDSADNIIVTAYVNGNADVNGDGDATDGGAESSAGYGNNDHIISVFNSSGTWQWAKRLGGTGSDLSSDIVADSANNIIVTGYIIGDGDVNGDGDATDGGAESSTGYGNNDHIISVFNSSGTWQWAKRLGGTASDRNYSVTIDSADNIISAGYVDGDADVNGDGDATDGGAESSTGYGMADAVISVFNSSGTWQWAKRFGGVGDDFVKGITTDSANNIIVTGQITGDVDVNGDGDATDGGAESSTGYGLTDILISVFNSSGTWQWAKRLGGTGYDYGYYITTDSSDNIIVIGQIIGDVDVNGDGDATDGGAESSTGYGSGDILISVFNYDVTPPVPSSFSPASGSTVSDRMLAITFTLNETGDCRVGLSDESYADMANDADCTGDGTTGITCISPDLGDDGAKTAYISCNDSSGNADTVSTNEHVSFSLNMNSAGGGLPAAAFIRRQFRLAVFRQISAKALIIPRSIEW